MVEKKELETVDQSKDQTKDKVTVKTDKKVQQDTKSNGKCNGIKNEQQQNVPLDKPEPTDPINHHPKKEELRAKVLEYIKENPEDFDLCDQELLKTSDLWINRFLNFHKQTFDQAYNHLIETFKWRKEFEVNTFDKTITPQEAWLSGGVFLYLPDKGGSPVLYLRGSMHHKIEERFYKLFQKLLVILLENIDRLGGKEFGWTVVLDLCGVGWSNVDVEMIHFLLNTSRKNYPNGCKHCIIHGLPWFLNFIAKGIFAALPSDTAEKIKFVSGSSHRLLKVDEMISTFDFKDLNNNTIKKLKESVSEEEEAKRVKLPIEEFIDINNLPDFLGGRCKINYKISPKGAQSAWKIGKARFDLSDQKIKSLMKPFQKEIDAAHKTLDEFRKADFKFEFEYDLLNTELEKYNTVFN